MNELNMGQTGADTNPHNSIIASLVTPAAALPLASLLAEEPAPALAARPLSARIVFGQNLRQARRLKKISQEDFATSAALSRTYVSEVERGLRNVSIDNMEALAGGIGIPLMDLLNAALFEVARVPASESETAEAEVSEMALPV